MTDDLTVYVNADPIGNDTEVYHIRAAHATRRRWTRDHVRETTAADARAEGLRPCKQCFPTDAARSCPACGFEAEDGACPNDDCRVETFREGSP